MRTGDRGSQHMTVSARRDQRDCQGGTSKGRREGRSRRLDKPHPSRRRRRTSFRAASRRSVCSRIRLRACLPANGVGLLDGGPLNRTRAITPADRHHPDLDVPPTAPSNSLAPAPIQSEHSDHSASRFWAARLQRGLDPVCLIGLRRPKGPIGTPTTVRLRTPSRAGQPPGGALSKAARHGETSSPGYWAAIAPTVASFQ